MKNPPETDQELLRRLGGLLDEAFPEERAEADEEIRAVGLDPAVVEARMSAFVEDLIASSPMNWRARAGAERAAELAKLGAVSRAKGRSVEDLREAVRGMLASFPQLQPQVSFHKFESASREDLETLLAELEFLQGRKDK